MYNHIITKVILSNIKKKGFSEMVKPCIVGMILAQKDGIKFQSVSYSSPSSSLPRLPQAYLLPNYVDSRSKRARLGPGCNKSICHGTYVAIWCDRAKTQRGRSSL